MGTRFRWLYATLALALVVWVVVRPGTLPLLLLVGVAVVAGLHALAALDARRGSGGHGVEHDISRVRSRYPDGGAY